MVVRNRHQLELSQVKRGLLKEHGPQAGLEQNNLRVLSRQRAWPFSLVLPLRGPHHQLNQSLFQLHPNSQETGNLVAAVLACGAGSPGSGSFMIQKEPTFLTGRGSLGDEPLLSHEVAFNNSENRKVSSEKTQLHFPL